MGRRLKNIENRVKHLEGYIAILESDYLDLQKAVEELKKSNKELNEKITKTLEIQSLLLEENESIKKELNDLKGAFDIFNNIANNLQEMQKQQATTQQIMKEYFYGGDE